MKTAIIVHGATRRELYFQGEVPAPSNNHWLPWLQKQLLVRGYQAWTPEMPTPYAPDYATWKHEFERYDLGPESLLVGYSCGGGFLLRWLSENKVPAQRMVLVAPWLDPEREKTTSFFEFTIDPGIIDRVDTRIFVSDNDKPDIEDSLRRIRSALPSVPVKIFPGYRHFKAEDLNSDQFPELLATLLEG